MPIEIACAGCGASLSVEPPVARKEECSRCGADLRVCLQCVFYDERAPNECREPMAEPVRSKDKANFCEYFRPRANTDGAAAASREDLRAAAEALFKKKSD